MLTVLSTEIVNLAPLRTQIGNTLRPQSITMVDKMQTRASSARVFRSRIPTLLVSMFATFASIYVAGRLWQDSENRVYLIKELDRVIGQGRSVISVDDTLKIIACREQHKKLSALEMELAAARQEGFTSLRSIEINGTDYKRRPLVVIGIFTTFGRKNNRDTIRKAWMGTDHVECCAMFLFNVLVLVSAGAALKKMENEKGIIARGLFGTQCSNWKAISITRIIWKLTTTSFHLHNRGILLLLVFFAAGAGRTMLISDAGKVYVFGKD